MTPTISLQQLIDEYNASKAQGWAQKSKASFFAKQKEFLSYFGPGRDIKTIEDTECVKLRDGLYLLPRSFRSMAKWRDSPLKEIIQHYIDAPIERHLSVGTVNSYMSHLSSLLGWAFVKKGWLHRNPMISVEMLKETDMSEHRRPPTDDELRKIFASKYLSTGKNAENNFWAFAILLASGMRLGEMCQMAVHEVEQVSDFWVFNVNANPLGDLPRRLKTAASARKIPVHPELIRLGLLDFLKKPRKNELIFPDAIADTHPGNVIFSEIYSKRLNRIMRKAGITDPAVVAHSLRHYCRKATKHAEIPFEAAKQIGGWTTGGDMAEHYGGRFSLKKLNKLMKRVKFKVLAGLERRIFGK